MKITAYCMDWHLSKSDAFRALVVDPLQERLEVELVDIKKWQKNPKIPQIFCQVAPPEPVLNDPNAKVVWVPMWDNVCGNDQAWWQTLPKHLRVVCFSKAAYEQASQAGLPALHLTYFNNPEAFTPVTWEEKVIYYWNRTGLIGPLFLERLCSAAKANRLIFRPDLDPGAPQELHYDLTDRLGPTKVEIVHEMDKQKYLEVVQAANIYIAPRPVEGVGMTFVEAMARGSAVMGYNAPTMNEYIKQKENGYLCDNSYSRQLPNRARNQMRKILLNRHSPYQLSDHQPWNEIKKLDWHKLGQQALDDTKAGHQRWLKDLDSYYQFLTKW